jgi:hypothetical protein
MRMRRGKEEWGGRMRRDKEELRDGECENAKGSKENIRKRRMMRGG